MKCIKMFSHNDLDGYAAPALFKHVINKELDDSGILCETITYSSTGKNGTIDADILEYLNDENKVSDTKAIYIFDLTPSLETLEKLDLISKQNGIIWRLFDHHKTALWVLEKFSNNCMIVVNSLDKFDQVHMESATSIAKSYLENHYSISDKAKHFAEVVRLYDTWEWSKLDSSLSFEANDLNNLFYFKTKNNKERLIIDCLKSGVSNVLDDSRDIIDSLEMKETEYIEHKTKDALFIKLDDYCVACVYGEQYISNLGNCLAKLSYQNKNENKMVDFSIVLHGSNGKSVSLRTLKDNIDVSKIAQKLFNGGGHQKAAGGHLINPLF